MRCHGCQRECGRHEFSKTQLKRNADLRRCVECVGRLEAHIEDAFVETMLEEMPEVEEPEPTREQLVVEELAKRRKLTGPARLRGKSDEIHRHFDRDGDGYLNYPELAALGRATGGELPEIAFGAVCMEVGADSSRGFTPEDLFRLYVEAGMGDVNRDHNLVFSK